MPREGIAVDYIVTNIGGCGSTMLEYDVLLRDDPEYASMAGISAAVSGYFADAGGVEAADDGASGECHRGVS